MAGSHYSITHVNEYFKYNATGDEYQKNED